MNVFFMCLGNSCVCFHNYENGTLVMCETNMHKLFQTARTEQDLLAIDFLMHCIHRVS
jgi:hypothetical protein